MLNLEKKVVLITGGSSGIGAACVKLFAKAGANVAFTYNKNKDAAFQLINSLSNENKIIAYKTKIESETSINKTVKSVLNDFKKIDILVNNAGVWEEGKIEEMTLEHWDRTIKINLTGTFLFTKAVVPHMKKNKYGRIINISSTAGQRGEATYSHYAASKGGMISFTKSLAAELGEFNITTNSVAPGWVITEMTDEVFSDKKYLKKEADKIPTKRIATAEDIAGSVLFLASDLARQINGEILNVNGGSVLCG